jgi:hypothetical protein
MRRLWQIALVMAVAGILAQSALAQPPQGRGRGGRGMGFGGGIGMLLRNPSVQKELKMDPDQVTKATEAAQKVGQEHQADFMALRNAEPQERMAKMEEINHKVSADTIKAVSGILHKDQTTRLKQIDLQRAGANGLLRPDVEEALKLTPDEKTKIKTIIDDGRKEMMEARQGGFGQGGPGAFQKMQEMQKQTTDKAVAVLTDDQKKTYKEMTGEPFHMEMQPFQGGPGGRRGRGAPPTDRGQ